MAKSIAFAVDASRLSRFVTSLDLGYRPGAPRTRGAPFADENIMCLHSMFSGCEGYLVGHALIVDSFCPWKDVTNLESRLASLRFSYIPARMSPSSRLESPAPRPR